LDLFEMAQAAHVVDRARLIVVLLPTT